MLNFSQVSLSIPQVENAILNSITFSIKPKEFVIVLGANGSGKSSLLKLITGNYQPSKGVLKRTAKTLGYLSQDTAETLFHDLTVLENCCLNEQIRSYAPFKMSTHQEQEIYSSYLKNFHTHLPHKMDTIVGKLSGGERQSLALALILKQNPDFLLLDEHTSALDPKTSTAIMKLTNHAIQDRGLTTIMVTHNVQHALDYGTRVIGLKEGSIVLDHQKTNRFRLTLKELNNIY